MMLKRSGMAMGVPFAVGLGLLLVAAAGLLFVAGSPTMALTPGEPQHPCAYSTSYGDGNNTIEGTDRFDSICAGGGEDLVVLYGTGDYALGEGQADTIRGGVGGDYLYGGGGNDEIYGGDGDDEIHVDGDDELVKGDQPPGDQVTCGEGHDTVYADGVADQIGDGCESVISAR